MHPDQANIPCNAAAATSPATDGSAIAAASPNGATSQTKVPKKRSAIPQPFKYRGRWRAQVTLPSGHRPWSDFDTKAEATDWIKGMVGNDTSEVGPELGGPKTALVAGALHHYARLFTLAKGGCDEELNRINHYLAGAGMPLLRRKVNEDGTQELETYSMVQQPKGWQKHNDDRRAKRVKTYALIHEIGRMRCSQVSKATIRTLMTTMKAEGLSDSTIQKEVSLLKHFFNMAIAEWRWSGFENPCVGLKLGKSKMRFVFMTKEQEAALWQAIAECDNPFFWPLVVCALETAQRKD